MTVTVPIAGSWDVSPRGYSAFCTFCSKCADVFSSVATFCFILFLHFHRIMSSSFIPLLISRLLICLLRLCSAVSVLWFPRRPSPASVLPLPRPFCSPWFLNLFSPPVAPFSLSRSLPIFLHFAPSLRPPAASLISPSSRHLFQPSWYLFFCHSHLTFAVFFWSASPLISSSPVEPSIINLSFFAVQFSHCSPIILRFSTWYHFSLSAQQPPLNLPCHHAAIYSFLDHHPQPWSDPHTSALISLLLPHHHPSRLINFLLSFPSPPRPSPVMLSSTSLSSPSSSFVHHCRVLTLFSPVLISWPSSHVRPFSFRCHLATSFFSSSPPLVLFTSSPPPFCLFSFKLNILLDIKGDSTCHQWQWPKGWHVIFCPSHIITPRRGPAHMFTWLHTM